METPFVFGKVAFGEEFTNRKLELNRLATNFRSSINTILISPRRWGKSSLVRKVGEVLDPKAVVVCFLDLYNIRKEEEFYQLLAQVVIKATSTRWEERVENSKNFISQFIPKLSYGLDPNSDFTLSLDWDEVKKQPDDILDLAEKIAKSKGIKLVICIDEFQNIGVFHDSLSFQKKLRAHWQLHQSVTYCLYGSKRHMLMELFASPRKPFYKFGDLVFLEKIKEQDWVEFIVRRFADTGKKISNADAAYISQLADCHSFYVQQLAQQCWLRTNKECSKAIIDTAFNDILMQLSLLFQNVTDSLSNTQHNFLQAMLKRVEHFSAKENLDTYRLGTSANIQRIKHALMEREIIDIENKKVIFMDPMYKNWLDRFYFNN